MRARRTDANHQKIVKALRKAGIKVADLSGIGRGIPDTLVSWTRGGERHTALLEIKNPDQPPSARQLTPAQVKFHRQWVGRIHVVMTPEEALAVCGVTAKTREG